MNKMYNPVIEETFTLTPKEMKWEQDKTALMNYDIEDLKIIFYELTGENVPREMLHDFSYSIANISQLILKFLKDIKEGKSIDIENHLYYCKRCRILSYFRSTWKGICLNCISGVPRRIKEGGVLSWN